MFLKLHLSIAVVAICILSLIQCFPNPLKIDSDEGTMRPGQFLHLRCRNALYPRSNVNRFPVPDNLTFWTHKFDDYAPVSYTSEHIKGKSYADPEIDDEAFKPKWNAIDGSNSRISYSGNYALQNNTPVNPFGRTGIIGRGLLGRWGPNHAADPIVTKWKRNVDGTPATDADSGRNILQMIIIERWDSHEWAIPGGMVDAGEKVSTTLRREFTEEALDGQEIKKINDFFDNQGVEIYQGYVDDPRNTDNAWMETDAYNFHDETGHIVGDVQFKAGDDAINVKWLDINQKIILYANHKDFIQRVTEIHNAHW